MKSHDKNATLLTSFIISLLVLMGLFLNGCAQYPNLVADHWVHSGNYGVVTTHYEATAITRVGEGFHIGTYTGSITVLGGYGMSDTIQGLTITPKTAAADSPLSLVQNNKP